MARTQGARRQLREARPKREAGVRPRGKTRGCLGLGWSLGWICGCRKVLGILPGAKTPAAKFAFRVIPGRGAGGMCPLWVMQCGKGTVLTGNKLSHCSRKAPWEPEWTGGN